MDKIKTREEIDNKDKWNLELVFKDIDEFNKNFKICEDKINKLEKMIPTFLDTSNNFKKFFVLDEDISRLIEKLHIYAHCNNDQDKGNSVYQELYGRISNLYTTYSEKTSSVLPMLISSDSKTIYEYLDKEDMNEFKYYFDKIFKRKEHTLSKEEEKIISMYAPVLDSSSDTFSYLTNADLVFENIKNEEGKLVDFNESNYNLFIKSKDRRVRNDAFNILYKGYEGIKNTLTSTYSSIVKYDSITSRLRNYSSSINMYLDPKNISVDVYKNLINTVRNNLDVLYDYYDMKKNILGVDEYHLYDSYVSVIDSVSKKYSFDEAKDIVINALSVYGDDYVSILKRAFTDRWIDIYPNKGKRGGAYSTGSYDTVPYVLLNYTNTYNDVSTIAHELGHSIHTYYSHNNNPYINSGYPIFLAEIASTTNELLLNDYMLKNTNDRNEKLSLLNEKLDLFKATIYRQTMFAEFELKAHEYVDNGGVLTSDYLCDLYYELNKDYFGDGVVVDDLIKYEWSRIPHFYTPFYVYQYATSLSISCYVARNIIDKKPGFVEKYIEFLKSGGRDYPLEVLKMIDIDLSNDKVFVSCIDEFRNTLDEFKKIYNEK